MEAGDPFEEIRKPELDNFGRKKLFEYAAQKQAWLRSHVSPREHESAILYLANELEKYVQESFETPPRVIVTSSDINRSAEPRWSHDGILIPTEPLPLEADDAALFGEQVVHGQLKGFHHSKNIHNEDELRMYISTGAVETQKIATGIFIPHLSICLESATIQFEEDADNKRSESLLEKIYATEPECRELTQLEISEVLKLTSNEESVSDRLEILKKCSEHCVSIEDDPAASQQLLDALSEWVKFKLKLETMLDIEAAQHRVLISSRGFRRIVTPKAFKNVSVEIDLYGETVNRWLGLGFEYGKGTVVVPVQNLMTIVNTEEQRP